MRALPVIGLLALYAGLSLASMRGKSETSDEPRNLRFGQDHYEGNLHHAMGQCMIAPALNAAAIDVAEHALGPLTRRRQIAAGRAASTLVAVLLGLFVYRWSSELYGRRGGLLSLTLYALSPNILTHGQLITNDILSTAGCFIATYLFVRYLRRPTTLGLVAAAVATGLAQLPKHTGLLLGPIFALIFVLERHQQLRAWLTGTGRLRVAGRVAAWTALFTVLVVITIDAGYRFRQVNVPLRDYQLQAPVLQRVAALAPGLPVPLPRIYLDALRRGRAVNATGINHGPIYLLGELRPGGHRAYFPIAAAIKQPLGLFLILGLALGGLWRAGPERRVVALLLIPVAAWYGALTLLVNAQMGFRYLLPTLPFLHVLCGRLVTRPAGWRRRLGAVALVWYGLTSLSFYPHFLSYSNELIGSRLNMWRYLADSNVDWSQNDFLLQEHLQRHPEQRLQVSPDESTTGRIVVSVNQLVGVTAPRQKYAWLRDHHQPVDHIGYSWLIFDVSSGSP